MITHYLKIAFRNMRKYKNQTLISVIGLAVGFTCFALAMLWIRYEMTYDSFHKNAGQMYVVYTPDASQVGYSRQSRRALAAHLKTTFPEVANATQIRPAYNSAITVNGVEYPSLSIISVDSAFFEMFDVKILVGSHEFLISGSGKIAITREKALQLFDIESPIGKTIIVNNNELTISTIVTGMSKQSNYPFDFIEPFFNFGTMNPWNVTLGDDYRTVSGNKGRSL